MNRTFVSILLATTMVVAFSAQAKEVAVKITKEKTYSTVKDNGELIKIFIGVFDDLLFPL